MRFVDQDFKAHIFGGIRLIGAEAALVWEDVRNLPDPQLKWVRRRGMMTGNVSQDSTACFLRYRRRFLNLAEEHTAGVDRWSRPVGILFAVRTVDLLPVDPQVTEGTKLPFLDEFGPREKATPGRSLQRKWLCPARFSWWHKWLRPTLVTAPTPSFLLARRGADWRPLPHVAQGPWLYPCPRGQAHALCCSWFWVGPGTQSWPRRPERAPGFLGKVLIPNETFFCLEKMVETTTPTLEPWGELAWGEASTPGVHSKKRENPFPWGRHTAAGSGRTNSTARGFLTGYLIHLGFSYFRLKAPYIVEARAAHQHILQTLWD